MSEMVQIAIISGCFGLLMIFGLAMSYKYKLKLTLQANEIERQSKMAQYKQDIKLAKIKNPRKTKRLPKGIKDQIMDWLELMGDERVQGLIDAFQEKDEDEIPEGNKFITTLMPLAKAFIEGMGEHPQIEEKTAQNY